jgi:hypothetical protein
MKTPIALGGSLVLALSGIVHSQSLPPGISITGRVIDGSTGKSLTGAVVFLWQGGTNRESGRKASAAPDGTFQFNNVAPGVFQIAPALIEPRFSYRTEPMEISVANQNITGLGLLITPAGPPLISLTGRLVMEGGARLPASLTRLRAGETLTTVNPDGSFQLRLRAREKYEIVLETVPANYYVKAVSTGAWNTDSQVLLFDNTPPSSIELTVAAGNRRIQGRILDSTKSPAQPGTAVIVRGPLPSARTRTIAPNSKGTFEVTGLRAGSYDIEARYGSGDSIQFAASQQTVGAQDLVGLEVVLRPLSAQKGRLVMEGIARLDDVMRFKPRISIKDILGIRQVTVRPDGTFDFQSFDEGFSAEAQGLPFGYDSDIVIVSGARNGYSVEVRIRIVQGLPGRI